MQWNGTPQCYTIQYMQYKRIRRNILQLELHSLISEWCGFSAPSCTIISTQTTMFPESLQLSPLKRSWYHGNPSVFWSNNVESINTKLVKIIGTVSCMSRMPSIPFYSIPALSCAFCKNHALITCISGSFKHPLLQAILAQHLHNPL